MIEFDCSECQRHIVAVVLDKVPESGLCVQCVYFPSWYQDPELRRIYNMTDDEFKRTAP